MVSPGIMEPSVKYSSLHVRGLTYEDEDTAWWVV